MKELHIEPVLDYIQHYQKQWKIIFSEWVQLRFQKSSLTVDQMEKGLWDVQWEEGVKILLWDHNNNLFGR
jgi:predicted restriction endonuclease